MANVSTCTESQVLAQDPACQTIMANFCTSDDIGGRTYIEKWQGDNLSSECRAYANFTASLPERYIPAANGMAEKYLVTEANSVTFPQQGSLVYDPDVRRAF